MEENEIRCEKLRTMQEASERISIENVLAEITSRMKSGTWAEGDGGGQLSALPGKEPSGEEALAQEKNNPAFIFRQDKRWVAVPFRQYMNDVARLAGWLQGWGMQGGRIVIAAHNAYGQSVALFAAMAAGCTFSVFSLLSKRSDLETFLWEQHPAALICGRREAEIGKRCRKKYDLKILQLSDDAENGLETVYA